MTPEESERLLRISAVFEDAVDLFEGDVAAAVNWLTTPRKALGDRTAAGLRPHRARSPRGRKPDRTAGARNLYVIVSAWRITKRKHARDAFTGEGAREFGGRWNNPGTAIVYTAQSQSLAALEMLVHLDSSELLAEVRIDRRGVRAGAGQAG